MMSGTESSSPSPSTPVPTSQVHNSEPPRSQGISQPCQATREDTYLRPVDRPCHQSWGIDDVPDEPGGDPVDGRYGWICTICVFFINAHTWGINASWGIFLSVFVASNRFPGATKFEYAVVGGLSIAMSLFIAPLAVMCQRTYGARTTMFVGSLVIFMAMFSASVCTQFWHLLVSQGLFFGWGMGLVYTPAMAILPHWFDMHRSLAVGIATAGAGLGGVAYSIITARLVAAVDIPWTYRILSFCGLASNATCSLLLRDHKRVARRHPSDKASASNVSTSTSRSLGFRRLAVRTEVLLVTAWGFVTELGYVALLYIFPYYAASAGLTPAQGSAAQAALNLGLGLGRPVVGHYSDRWGRINVALAATLLCALLCLVVWTLAGPSFPALLAFAFLAGVVAGTFWTTFAPVLAEVVGLDEYAGAFAFVCMALVLPNTFAEAVTMQMVNDTKVPGEEGVGWRFLGAQAFVGGMFLGGAVFLWLLRAWKVCNNERGATQREEEYVMESPAGQSESEAGEGREGSAVGTERAVRMEEQRWLTMKRLFAVAKV